MRRGGLVLLLAIVTLMVREFLMTHRVPVVLTGALLAGIGTITLFDHYFWSLAPGRMLLGLILGVWFGQVGKQIGKDDE
jgi:hypothetical protein